MFPSNNEIALQHAPEIAPYLTPPLEILKNKQDLRIGMTRLLFIAQP